MENRKCLNCGAQIEQTPKKRTRIFCNSTCRSSYWQKANRQKDVLPTEPNSVDPPSNTSTIDDQIAAIRSETIPADRNTVIGRRVWKSEQKQRILALELSK